MRSKSKSKENKKYIRKILFTIIVFGAVSFLLWGYTKPKNFPIRHVKIFAPYQYVGKETIQKIVLPYTSSGFFYLNVIGLKQQLLKLPWVYVVSIQRKWPDIVNINIVEQHAILQWGTNSLINSEGTIFSPPLNSFPKDLPIIFGPEDHEAEIFILYHKMLTLLEPLDLTIKKILLHPKHYWEILLSNDTLVYLKEKNPLDQLELMVNIYRKITFSHNQAPKSLDLRYSAGLAVKWN